MMAALGESWLRRLGSGIRLVTGQPTAAKPIACIADAASERRLGREVMCTDKLDTRKMDSTSERSTPVDHDGFFRPIGKRLGGVR